MAISNGYATLPEIKSYVGIPSGDTADDTLLELAVESASREIDMYVGRRFWIDPTVVTRVYTTTDEAAVDIPDGIATTTGLVVKTDDDDDGTYETTWTIDTDFRLEPVNAAADGLPWTRLVATGDRLFPTTVYRGVQVTAKGGFATVPTPVKQACLILAGKLFKRKDAVFGVAGSPEYGSEVRILAGDRDAERLLSTYRRPWVVV